MKIVLDCDYKSINNKGHINKISEYKSLIRQSIRLCLKEENTNINQVEVFLKFTTDDEIKEINNQYRHIDKETDVLSFPVYEKDDLNKVDINTEVPLNLGDIIVSISKVVEQSKEYGHTFKRELIYLIVHAMFHLLGYDHMNASDKKIMRTKEEIIMEEIKIGR